VDGTLLRSNDAHASSWTDALADFGVHRSVHVLRRLVGMGSDQLFAQIGVSERIAEIADLKTGPWRARARRRVAPA
jgi:beta-phosphoglucomutase-like phosphatase (HAD superfamily)